MKTLLILMLFVGFESLFAGENKHDPWPPKGVSFVVGYCFDFIQDDRGGVPVFPDGSLHRGIIHSATVRLSDEQQRELFRIVSTPVELEDSSDCFFPRHAFVFYDGDRRPVGWVAVCLACENYEFSSQNASLDVSFKKLAKFCADVKLPIFTDQNGQGLEYTTLFTVEQPMEERKKVMNWQQFMNRQIGKPLDWVPPIEKAPSTPYASDDPFAPRRDEPEGEASMQKDASTSKPAPESKSEVEDKPQTEPKSAPR